MLLASKCEQAADPSSVNPIYYVTFTTATLVASFVLFQGFNTQDPVNTISLLCGFLIIFTGVYLLNLSRTDPNGQNLLRANGSEFVDDGIPTDGLSGLSARRSMQMRRSETFGRSSIASAGRRSDANQRLLARDEEVGLRDLTEDSDSEDEMHRATSPRSR
jgi:hypothetical protein